MSQVWFTSDLHLGHGNIAARRERKDNFPQAHHDELILDNLANSLGKRDVLYVLGDVSYTEEGLWRLKKLPGRKIMIMGNHDVFPAYKYLEVFEDVRGAFKWKHGTIITHIPIHSDEFYRWKLNIHGHLHWKKVMWHYNFSLYEDHEDLSYFNVCLEVNNYCPVNWDTIKERLNANEPNETGTREYQLGQRS